MDKASVIKIVSEVLNEIQQDSGRESLEVSGERAQSATCWASIA